MRKLQIVTNPHAALNLMETLYSIQYGAISAPGDVISDVATRKTSESDQ